LLSVETLYAYFKTARATRNHRTEGGWKRHLVVKLLGITVETCTKEELEPQYSLLKEFVREALHDNFLLVRVEARQVFSSLYDTWPERVNEFVYLPAPRIRGVDGGWVCDHWHRPGSAAEISIQDPCCCEARPSQGGRSSPCCQSTQRGGLSHAAGCAALGCAVHGDSGGMAAVAQFWTTHVKGRTTHARSTSVQGEARPVLESTKHPTMQARSKEPPRSHPWTTCKW
ncbi:hypothetical protein Ae201684P_020660, partial [Aphanomyces euteiches]